MGEHLGDKIASELGDAALWWEPRSRLFSLLIEEGLLLEARHDFPLLGPGAIVQALEGVRESGSEH